MEWKTIISFTNNNRPYRYKVATMKRTTGEQAANEVYNVQVEELDEFDNSIDVFEFNYKSKEDHFQTTALNKPVLLITEQMVAAVNRGDETW